MTKMNVTGKNELEILEHIVQLMKNNYVTKLKTVKYEIELDRDAFEEKNPLTEAENEMIKHKLESFNVDATDEDILMNPYHGIGG